MRADLIDRGYDITDVLSGRRSWAWLRVLIQHLPPESHTMTAMRNELSDEQIEEQADTGEPEKGRWSQLEQLVAVVADRLARLEYVYVCANVEKPKQPTAPEPLRRPGAKPPKPKPKLSEASTEILYQLINGGAA